MGIPKIFTKGIRVPAGPYQGSLALPCPCGEPVDLEGERELALAQLASGQLAFFHVGCATTVPGAGDAGV